MTYSIQTRKTAVQKAENNFWWKYNPSSDTVVVFVHGIFSDSLDCWTSVGANGDTDVYWPKLFDLDTERIGEPSIYMGGFFTAVDAGSYDVFSCSKELFSALDRPNPKDLSPSTVMQFKRIIFVCHSTGGIVVRHLLCKNRNQFKGKSIGLVLIASPSSGSALASVLAGLSKIYNSKLAGELKAQSPAIVELDRNFKDLVHDKSREFELSGVEAYENRFVVHRKWLPDIVRVVTEESAGKYFGAPIHLAKTDHFTAVKPRGLQDAPHLLLVDFLRGFKGLIQEESAQALLNPEAANVKETIDEDATSNSTQKITLHFDSCFKANQISISKALSAANIPIQALEIQWPASLLKNRDKLQRIADEVSSGSLPTGWYEIPHGLSIADFYEGITRAIKESNELTTKIEFRLKYSIGTMAGMSSYQTSPGFTPPRVAITSLLALAVLRIGLPIAYWASYEPVRAQFELDDWLPLLRMSKNSDRMALVFGETDEPIYSVRVKSVGGAELLAHSYEYLYGPKSEVKRCDGESGRILVGHSWFHKWVIPQTELILAERQSTEVCDYDGSITTTGVVKDQDGHELKW